MTFEFAELRVPLREFTLAVDVRIESPTLGVFGPSGAGKTTLLETIAGLRMPASGTLSVCGRDVTAMPPQQRGVGYVPQDDTLFPHMNVRENIEYGAARHPVHTGLALPALAALLGIDTLLEAPVQKLSGGERRRVAIARALRPHPAVLLLDEPLAGLDAGLRARTLELIATVQQRLAIPMVLVTHERDEVIALCEMVIVLDRGAVGSAGPPAAVL